MAVTETEDGEDVESIVPLSYGKTLGPVGIENSGYSTEINIGVSGVWG